MHVQGVIEYRTDQQWVGATDLPHLPPAACSPVFGLPDSDEAVTHGDGNPVGPARGIPDDYSDLFGQRYFKDASSVYGDTGPWRHATGESWVLASELPASVREDERWSGVLDALEAYEREYGPENVRLVVWVES